MHQTESLGRSDGVTTQGTKRSRSDETNQVLNKAARLRSTTSRDSTRPNNGANENSQLAINTQERQLTAGVPTIHQNDSRSQSLVAVPSPNHGSIQPNRQSLGPAHLDHSTGQPSLGTSHGPVPTYPSLHTPSGVQNMQLSSSISPDQYNAPLSGPRQSGTQQSAFQHLGPHHSGPQYGHHHQVISDNNVPGTTNPAQASTSVDTTHISNLNVQSDSNLHSAVQARPSPSPSIHDIQRITHISQSVARLNNTKVLEILACAAVYHPDVLLNVENALSQQQDVELQRGNVLFGHLIAVSSENATRMSVPAQVTHHPQRQYSQAQNSTLQHCPPQGPQRGPGRGLDEDGEDDQDDESEQGDEDEPETEPRSFDEFSARVDYILHSQYAELPDPQQVHINEALHNTEEACQDIADQVRPNSLYETKHSAMRALCNIGKMILGADGWLGNKVKVDMVTHNTIFVKALRWLYDSMTRAERHRISRDYLKDLQQLHRTRGHIFPGFGEIVMHFTTALSRS